MDSQRSFPYNIPYFSTSLLALFFCVFLPLSAYAGIFTAFGPQNYTRSSGSPQAVIFNFSVLNPNTDYTLKIFNGGLEDGEFELVSSSVFILNGSQIVSPNEFNQNVTYIEKGVSLSTTNELSVELRGKPGGGLTVEIVGLDNDPPTITAILDLQANAAGWHKQDVTVSFVCDDAISGVATCPDPILVDVEGAAQVITGTAVDNAGNSQTTSVLINLDLTPPDLSSSISPVPNSAAWNKTDPTISFSATDATSGISSVSPDVTITTEGANQVVTGTATDLADNTATLDVTINLDKTAPTISASSSPLPNANGWNNTDVNVSFTGTDSLSGIDTITPLTTATFEGANQTITGTAVDVAGNSVSTSVILNIDLTAPSLNLSSPPDGLETNQIILSVTGTATDANGIVNVDVNGSQAFLVGNDFDLDVSLIEGSNTITVTARDIADNSATQTRTVSLDSIAPVVTISSPSNLSTFNTSTVSVTGTVDDPLATLKVNGVDATITTGAYSANITLGEGTRFITAVAQDPLGNTGTANISVTIDTTPPRVILSTPDGITVFSSPITVTGMINDIVSGTVNGNNATVTVNGVSASVSNRGFMAENVSLISGQNTITAIGTDTAGNQAQASITVTLDTTAQARINIISGNNQTGAINTALAQPLIVELIDAQGSPLANRSVTFSVTRNDGILDSGPRSVTLNSNTLGLAQVTLTLGSYAGAGENRVEVSSPGFPGKVLFTATGVAGNASMIHPTGMSAFRGEAGNALPESPQVFVNDGKGNPVQGVPVTFSIIEGQGLVNNQTQTTVNTNSDGKAHVTWILGPDEGITNNRVEATFTNNTGLPVTFVASGVIPGDPNNTSFSGIVLTNTEQPIEGVTITIDGTALTTQTDTQGQFQLTGVPVGAIHVIADGNTAILPGFTYQMMYEVNTVAGRDNTVGMPIYLLPLDLPNAQTVTPSQGANIAVSSVAGFSLDIPAGGITFSDGTQTGSVSVTQVHRDKVPMPPPNGLNPKLVFTIQPAGAVFDPPAPISFPNVYEYEPGLIVTLYSFDHDLGQWVAVGTGHVTEDGAFITSDPGIGIIEGGWHFPQCAQQATTVATNDSDRDGNSDFFEAAVNGIIKQLENRNNAEIDLALKRAREYNSRFRGKDLFDHIPQSGDFGGTDVFQDTEGNVVGPEDPKGAFPGLDRGLFLGGGQKIENEDINGNGNLDPGEDLNNNGDLDIDPEFTNTVLHELRHGQFLEEIIRAAEGEDTNGNGILDPGEDIDGDGEIDGPKDIDIDNDHVPDFREGDLDGDGDNLMEDVNGDGRLNPGEDTDGDGKLDVFIDPQQENTHGIKDVPIDSELAAPFFAGQHE